MKEPRKMELPREVLIGPGVIDSVGLVCQNLGFKNSALIVSGSTTMKIAGQHVKDVLADTDIDNSHVIIKVANELALKQVQKQIQEDKHDVVIGVGGGKVIDVSKLASTRENVCFISVPTAASHDGIASCRASIKNKEGPSVSVKAQAPIAIIADTEIIRKAPYRLLAAGCGDLVANYTAVKDWRLAYRLRNTPFSEYAAALSEMTACIIMDSATQIRKGLEESTRIVMKALISSGVAMSIAGSSRPASGSEHKFSHALDMVAPEPALHGEQCGVGTIMMMYLHGGDWKHIRDTLKTIGAPTNADELGIEPEYVIEALTKANTIRPKRYTILSDRGLTKSAAERLATIIGVI